MHRYSLMADSLDLFVKYSIRVPPFSSNRMACLLSRSRHVIEASQWGNWHDDVGQPNESVIRKKYVILGMV